MNHYTQKKGPGILQYLVMISIFAILVLSIITGIMLLESLINPDELITLGYPWTFYKQVLTTQGGGHLHAVWNLENLLFDFLVFWVIMAVIFTVRLWYKAKTR